MNIEMYMNYLFLLQLGLSWLAQEQTLLYIRDVRVRKSRTYICYQYKYGNRYYLPLALTAGAGAIVD
jgi:hypothetical protein